MQKRKSKIRDENGNILFGMKNIVEEEEVAMDIPDSTDSD